MPKGTNQKFKLYRLAQIMLEKTDDELLWPNFFVTFIIKNNKRTGGRNQHLSKSKITKTVICIELFITETTCKNNLKDIEKRGYTRIL